MQLERKPSIRQALAVATCAVLTGNAHADGGTSEWKADSSVLYYSEEGRVTVVEPVVFVTRQLAEEETVTFKAIYDSMTGASPNGATPTGSAQTFTSPSGSYTTPAGETPKRDFFDRRVAAGLDWSKRTSALVTRNLGANISVEEDYLSTGGSVSYARDLNDRLTTLAVGAGLSLDLVQPHGGAPVGLQSISVPVGEDTGDDDADTSTGASGLEGERKTLADVMVGITQVLSRRSLVQLNYTHSELDGYLTDPYKILSVIDPSTGGTVDYVHEKRPDTRSVNAVYGKYVYHFGRDVMHVAYRYFQDDWGIRAHTGELRYHLKLGESLYLEPQARYYTQTAADFFRHSLQQGETVDYASADLRLGEMTATTFGLKVGMDLAGGELSFRYARMQQTGESQPADAIGTQRNFDLYPTLDATMINLSYSMAF